MFWLDCWCRDCAVHFTIFTNLFRDFGHFWPWLHCALSLAAHCIVIGPICLCICLFICVCVCLWVCYHDNSKLRALIFTKLPGSEGSDHLQLVKFWPSCAPGKGVCGGAKIFGSALLQPARNVYVSLGAFFIFCCPYSSSVNDTNRDTLVVCCFSINAAFQYFATAIDQSFHFRWRWVQLN